MVAVDLQSSSLAELTKARCRNLSMMLQSWMMIQGSLGWRSVGVSTFFHLLLDWENMKAPLKCNQGATLLVATRTIDSLPSSSMIGQMQTQRRCTHRDSSISVAVSTSRPVVHQLLAVFSDVSLTLFPPLTPGCQSHALPSIGRQRSTKRTAQLIVARQTLLC